MLKFEEEHFEFVIVVVLAIYSICNISQEVSEGFSMENPVTGTLVQVFCSV